MGTVKEVYLCNDCDLVKPVSEYYKSKSKRGHEARCKECRKASMRLNYYYRTKDKIEKEQIVEEAISSINSKYETTLRDRVKSFINKRF